MLGKIYLGFNALVFIGYGLACLAAPSVVADQTGMQLSTGVASAEVRAMYGGLQTSAGLLALLGLLRPGVQPAVYLAFVFVFFGLASGRMVGILVDPDPGAYNFAAFVFEAVFGMIALMLLSKSSAESSPAAG